MLAFFPGLRSNKSGIFRYEICERTLTYMRIRWSSRWSIKKRLLCIISLLIFFSVTLVIALTYFSYTNDLTALSTAQTAQLLDQLVLNTDTYLEELLRLCLSPYYKSDVMQQLELTTETAQERLQKRRTIEDFLAEVLTIPRGDILRAYILTDAIYMRSKTRYAAGIPEDFAMETWYQDALHSSKPIFLPVRAEEQRSSPPLYVFSIAQQLRSTRNSDRVLGVIRVDANYSGIQAVCDRAVVTPGTGLFILDYNDNRIYQNAPIGDDFSLEMLTAALRLHPNESFTLQGQSDTYLVQTQSLSSTDWRIVSVRSQKELVRTATVARNRTIGLALLCALLGVVIAAPLVRSFLRPVFDITALMKQVEEGDFSVRFEREGDDELHYLGRSFNDMTARVQDAIARDTLLTRQIYEAKYLQKEAQYIALYNQIRPHFLFNALSTVQLLIKCGREQDAADCIDQLSTLLRGLINTGQQTTLAAECKLVDSYLRLQKTRHDTLSYSIDIPEKLCPYQMPAMLLQPLVENALIHGCEPKRGRASICVHAASDDQSLFLHVKDDGVGMTTLQLDELRTRLREEIDMPLLDTSVAVSVAAEQRGVGLLNICRRVRLR